MNFLPERERCGAGSSVDTAFLRLLALSSLFCVAAALKETRIAETPKGDKPNPRARGAQKDWASIKPGPLHKAIYE